MSGVNYFAKITDRTSEGKCSLNETISNKPYCIDSMFNNLLPEDMENTGLFEKVFRSIVKELERLAKLNILPHGDITNIVSVMLPQLLPLIIQYDLAKGKEGWEVAAIESDIKLKCKQLEILEQELEIKRQMLKEQEWKTKIAQAQVDPSPIKEDSILDKTRKLTCQQIAALKGELLSKASTTEFTQELQYHNWVTSYVLGYGQLIDDPTQYMKGHSDVIASIVGDGSGAATGFGRFGDRTTLKVLKNLAQKQVTA